jgi:hypothetical protein
MERHKYFKGEEDCGGKKKKGEKEPPRLVLFEKKKTH